jgi:hypothetical protein
MATWTGLGDNMELFWAVLSQWERKNNNNRKVKKEKNMRMKE